MQIVDNKALLVRTDNPSSITDLIKKSRTVSPDEVVVHWGLKEAQTLADLKYYNVPSPIERDYRWTGKLAPFAHQKTTAGFLTVNRKAFCFSEAGTAKTATVIWAADYLMKIKKIKRVLVVCPVSIMRSAWQKDLFSFAMHRSCDIAHGDAKLRKRVIHGGAEFVIINPDGLAMMKDEIIKAGFDLVVVDECTVAKNPQTARWKALHDITKNSEWLWMLTGTPAAQSPLDAYGLAKLVNPAATPRFFSAFRDSIMLKVTQFKWVPKPHAQAVVHQLLQPAIRYERKDCLDLPDVLHVDREAPLTPQQKRYYATLKNQMLFEADGEEVSAVNAAVKIQKLLQISGGAVYAESGEVVEFDVSNRLAVVKEVIEEASHKVLVFVPYTHTITLLEDYLTKEGISCAVINGAVPVHKRATIVDDFQMKTDPRVLILQPQAAAHGLTLTAANTIIWYAPVTSVETYLQANARINRPGQKNEMLIVNIQGSEVERRLYAMLQGNIDNHEKIIDLYRQEMEETP